MPVLATVFPAAAGIGLFLAVVQVLIWLRIRDRPAFLAGAAMSAGAGAMALCEAGYLGVVPLDRFVFLFEAQNVAIAVTLIAMVWFVRSRLGTGRVWLAWMITLSWTISAAISVVGGNGEFVFATFEDVKQAQTIWGEVYSVPEATLDPLKYIADLTSLAIILFVIDATVAAYRKGDRYSALLVGGPILFFIFVAGIHTPLVDAGVIQTPYIISLIFVAISMSLAIGLVDEVVRTSVLTRRLELERQRWNALLEGLELAVVRIGPSGRVAYVNPFVERLSGRSAADLVGKDPIALTPEDQRTDLKDVLSNSGSWSSRSRVHRSLTTASGKTRQLVWFSVSLRSEDDQPDGIIAVGQDITDQLEAEAARDQTDREIEKLSRAMTMGELASTFAHELSQPIAAVLSNAQTLRILQQRSGDSDTEIGEVAEDILRDTRRARDLMNRVREFMYNEAPRHSSFELGEMIEESLAMLSSDATVSGITLDIDQPAQDVWVDAARLELQQVVLNLVLNAIQAIETGGGNRITTGYRKLANGIVELSVTDNGPGLSDAQTETIFRPFVSTKSMGTGIGLAVVRRIAERHNGHVSAANGQSGGARFTLSLPIAEETAELAVG